MFHYSRLSWLLLLFFPNAFYINTEMLLSLLWLLFLIAGKKIKVLFLFVCVNIVHIDELLMKPGERTVLSHFMLT